MLGKITIVRVSSRNFTLGGEAHQLRGHRPRQGGGCRRGIFPLPRGARKNFLMFGGLIVG